MRHPRLVRFSLAMLALATVVAISSRFPTATVEAAPGKSVVGYVAAWEVNTRARAQAIDGSKFTHLVYAFAGIDAASNSCTEEWTDPGSGTSVTNMGEIVAGLNDNKAENSSLKVIMSIGGAGYKTQYEQLTDYSAFASSCVNLMNLHGMDGIDIDYEFPENDSNRQRLTSIMQAMNAALPSDKFLSMALAGGDYYGQWQDVGAINSYADWYNVMAFNHHGSWESTVHFNSPSTGCADGSGLCFTGTATYWSGTRAVAKSKLVIGMPWYSNHYTTAGGCSSVPGSTGYSSLTNENYKTYRTNGTLSGPTSAGSGWTRGYNTTYQNPYLCNSDTWIGYDDQRSVEWKADWVKNNAYQGVMMWEVGKDYDQELIGAVCYSFTCPVPTSGSEAYFYIINRNSGKCVDVSSNGTSNGTNIQQWNCNSSDAQQWQLIPTDSGYYRVVAKTSNKVMDVYDVSTADGANVHLWSWAGGNNQQFLFERQGSHGWFRIKARHSSKCVEVNDSSTADGANIRQWSCHTGNNQQFRLEPVGQVKVINKNSGKCLDVDGWSTADGADILQWTCGASQANQLWTFQHNGDGWYRIMNVHSDKAVSVESGSTADGAKLHQWTYGGGHDQWWRIEPLADGYLAITARHSGKVVDVPSGSLDNGAWLQQWTWNASSAQRFKLNY